MKEGSDLLILFGYYRTDVRFVSKNGSLLQLLQEVVTDFFNFKSISPKLRDLRFSRR